MKTFKWLAVSAGVALGALSATPGQARDLIYGSWLGPKSTTNTVTMTQYLDKIKKDTDGAVSFKLLAGGQVAVEIVPHALERPAQHLHRRLRQPGDRRDRPPGDGSPRSWRQPGRR